MNNFLKCGMRLITTNKDGDKYKSDIYKNLSK